MNEIRAELERVGVSYGKAGAADYVAVEVCGVITLLGPPRPPRRRWRGQTSEALRRLEGLDDNAGMDSFWAHFSDAPSPHPKHVEGPDLGGDGSVLREGPA